MHGPRQRAGQDANDAKYDSHGSFGDSKIHDVESCSKIANYPLA
jgi:hypothetical protein